MNKRDQMRQPRYQSSLDFKPRVTILYIFYYYYFLLRTKKTRNGRGHQLFVQNDIIKEGDGTGH